MPRRNPGLIDDENPEWTPEMFAQARPLAEVDPVAAAALKALQRRGKQKAPTKAMLAIRVDRAALDAYRATGRGWQTRLAAVIARSAQRLSRRTG
jgi:uncharacterized protein (DUF4415 family)